MIKISYPKLVKIATTMGFDPYSNYDSLQTTLEENNIEVTTRAEPPGYILTFPTAQHEMLFRLKYAEILHPISVVAGVYVFENTD